MSFFSRSTEVFLEKHGGTAALSSPQGVDGELLARVMKGARPSGSSWCEETRTYLAVLTDLLGGLDERLYHFYRPVTDLFRQEIRRLSDGADGEDSVWQAALARGTALGLPEIAEINRHPHLFVSGGAKK